MNNSQLPLAIRREHISTLWIKCQGVTVVSDWQRLNKLSTLTVHNRHQFVGAGREQCVTTAIDGQARRLFTSLIGQVALTFLFAVSITAIDSLSSRFTNKFPLSS